MSEKNYDVFLSCKSEDYSKAEPIYHWLVANGHRPFFAPISLKVSKIHGEPVVFGDEIDDALDEADNMIVFTSNAEYVKRGYVKDEWRTYVEEQRTGRKTGMLITILDEVRIEELPIRLRSVQAFDLSNYQDGVLRFLGDTFQAEEILVGNPQIRVERQSGEERRCREKEQKCREGVRRTKELAFTVGGVPFKMIRVEGGSMGTFYIGETQVTQKLWQAVMGDNPSKFKGQDHPVEFVSWNDICGNDGSGTDPNCFLYKLNKETGKKFRLPKESEWEYAAKGGNKSKNYTYAGSDNIDEVAWYWKNSGNKYLEGSDDDWNWDTVKKNNAKTHPVKQLIPNELGIHDMSGNVWEWCQDLYAPKGSDRVLRGGSWCSNTGSCRVANRYSYSPGSHGDIGGFRLALVQ